MSDSVEGEDAEELSGEHEDIEELFHESRRREERVLTVLQEQNETQAVHTEILRSVDEQVTREAKAKNRIIYALLAVLAGVLYAAGLFEPVEVPFLAGLLIGGSFI